MTGTRVLSKVPAIVRYYSSVFGPYPFNAVGAVVDRASWRRLRARDADQAGLRLDARRGHARSRARAPVVRRLCDARAVAGHLAARGVRHLGGVDVERAQRRRQRRTRRSRSSTRSPRPTKWLWEPPAGDPGTPGLLFCDSVYERGAHDTPGAAREGRRPGLLRASCSCWAQDHQYGNVTTPEFIALAEQQSGMDLGAFFQTWLYTPGKPSSW